LALPAPPLLAAAAVLAAGGGDPVPCPGPGPWQAREWAGAALYGLLFLAALAGLDALLRGLPAEEGAR